MNPPTFQHGERLEEGSPYEVLDKDGADATNQIARPLGEPSGAGVVYRARFKGRLERAIKFLAPPGISSNEDYQRFSETFDHEVKILSQITHTNCVKISDFGELDRAGLERPTKYLVMDFIEGQDLADAFPNLEINELLTVFDQVLDALAYLHTRGILHNDVKGRNIRVRRDGGSLTAVLVDFGIAKVRHTGDANDDTTWYYATRSTCRESRTHWIGKQVPISELESWGNDPDLYAFGLLLDELLTSDALQRLHAELIQKLGQAGVDALTTIAARLFKNPVGDYKDGTSLRNDWAKLQPGYLSPLGLPELSLAAHAKTSIATPLGRVSLTERLHEVINHPLFQRLRNIPQLELMHLVFPGARHSRLAHAISSFDMARQYLAHLLNDPNFRLLVNATEIEACLFLALLHDLGHYPLSHMFEDFAVGANSLTLNPGSPTATMNFLDALSRQIPTE